jgi:hypothetical protein
MTTERAIEAVQPVTPSGGATIATGLHAGWLALSPNWRGAWPGGDARHPLDYGTPNLRKAVLLIANGDNDWQGSVATNPGASGEELFYNAYGRLADQLLPVATVPGDLATTAARADAALDQRLLTLCAAMKQPPAAIVIHVIGVGVTRDEHRALLRACASSPDHYLEMGGTAAADTVAAVFDAVGARLAGMMLVR